MTGVAFPVKQYLVAFNNAATDNPASITTVASPAGTLGGNNVWTDITPYVSGHQLSRGRQHELDQFEAGTIQLDLNNQDGRFNPWNTSGPYTGLLVPRKLVQYRVTTGGSTYTRFTGQVDAWPSIWQDPFSQFAQVHATDAMRTFQLAYVVSGGYPAQVLADGATAYWRLVDPVSSTTVYDYTGNGYTGSVQGTVTFGGSSALPDVVGTSAAFGTGASATGCVVAGSAVTGTSIFSVEAWVNVTTANLTSFGGTGWVWQRGILGLSIGGVSLVVSGGATYVNGFGVQATTGNVGDGNWHYVVATNAGTASAIYVDGVQVQTGSYTSLGSTGPEVLGGTLPGPTIAFPGSLQEVAVYTGTQLSPTQVANHYALATFPQEGTGARINRVLTAVGWSAGARNVDSGVSMVQQQTTSLTTTTTLSHMQDVEATENGALYIDVSGNVRFISRDNLITQTAYSTVQATFGDSGTQIPFEPSPTLALDDIDLYNEASGQRQNGVTQVWDNAASIAAYGRTTWQPSGTLLGIEDSEVLGLCQYIVRNRATPVTRIQSIDINVLSLIQTAGQVATVMGLELLYQVEVQRAGVPGTAFDQVGLVEKIDEIATPDTWTVTFGLDTADLTAYWIMGTSEIGVNTALYF